MTKVLESLFAEAFVEEFNTLLSGGAEEPLYEPAEGRNAHIIHYRYDYFASALHEVAHWCVAGTQRRLQVDYGYWYAEDGRSQEQQNLFEAVEVRPQAMEWVFAVASGRYFRVSADNLAQGLGPSDAFKMAIYQQVQQFCERGLPSRAARFSAVLSQYFGVVAPLDLQHYRLQDL